MADKKDEKILTIIKLAEKFVNLEENQKSFINGFIMGTQIAQGKKDNKAS